MLVACCLTLFRMGIFMAAHGWGDQKGPPSLKSVTHILQWWNLAQLYLTYRRSKRIYESRDTPPKFYWYQHFFTRNQQILLYKKYKYRLHFGTQFLFFLTFIESLRIFLIKLVIILMMSAKMATPGLLKITAFWN